MKSILLPLSILLITSVSVLSCATDNTQSEESESMDASAAEDSYQPGEEWNLVWSDEFEGETLNEANWNRQVEPAGKFNDEWQRYTNSVENAYIENSQLVIEAKHAGEGHGMDEYTSARLNTANKQSWTYGKIAARIRLPYGMGIWPAFWMLGANINENGGDTPWPQCGEIDILELYGAKDDSVIEANLHYADSTDSHAQMGAVSYHLEGEKFAENFHVFELEWDAQQVVWRVDGEEFASKDISSDEYTEFQRPMFLLLNIAVGGTFAGRPDETTPFPQKMIVDWVRVFQK